MTVSISHKAGFLVLDINNEFSIFTLQDDFPVITSALEEDADNILVNLTSVSDMDTPALQALMWFRQRCNKNCQLTVDVREGSSVSQMMDRFSLTEMQIGKRVSTRPE